MEVIMSYSVKLQQSQQQKTTPQSIQCIQLLPMPLIVLEKYLNSLIVENPLLEYIGEERFIERDKYDFSQSNQIDYEELGPLSYYYERDDLTCKETAGSAPESDTLVGSLRIQLYTCGLDPFETSIGLKIINEISEDGYFVGSLKEISRSLSCDFDKVEQVLRHIQTFTPSGVGARSLSECLSLQIEPLHPDREIILSILENHVEDLESRRFTNLASIYKISRTRVQSCIDYLSGLNPYPGASFTDNHFLPFIIPDVSIKTEFGRTRIQTYGRSSELLSINTEYIDMMHSNLIDSDTKTYLMAKYRLAKELMGSVDMRHSMLKRVSVFLSEYQSEFFNYGKMYLKPLTMQKMAEYLGVRTSTISRTVSDKYVETRWGIVPMHFFFSESLGSGDGDKVSANVIKEKIKAIIALENPIMPVSDLEIANRLKETGTDISRRTVSKYRQDAGISQQKMRRRYS